MNEQKLIQLEDKFGAHNYKPLDVVIEKGEGVWVWDVEGKKYMDFLAAYSALNQGHCHPRLIKVMRKQLEKLTLTSRAFRNNQLPLFYQKLSELTGFEKILPMNTGAEAIETAIKAARKWGYSVKGIEKDKAEIICFENNFHGRTTTIVSMSSDEQYRTGFGPFTPGFKNLPYNDINIIKKNINKNTAAILLEPIQGEAGVIIPDKNYLVEIRKICDKNNILMILDEIQSGLGRTGKLFAYEHAGIKPDGVTIGKALSGGMYPVSAFLSNHEIMELFNPGDHGSTYGGNPIAAAVSIEAINILQDENLLEKTAQLGAYAMDYLKQIKSSVIKKIRGIGLWIAIDLKKDAPNARKFCEKLQHEGLLCKEAHGHTIRFAPPLTITKDELNWALKKIKKVMES